MQQGRWRLPACVLVASVVAACSTEKLSLGSGCARTSECDTPLVCRLARCRNECNTTRDCAAGLSCVLDQDGLGACQLPDDRACAQDSDCAGVLVCRERQCVNACAEDRDCPTGAACEGGGCIDRQGRACTRHVECESAGLVCALDQRCRQECLNSRDCRFGTQCVGSVCVEGAGADAGPPDAGRDGGPPLDAGGDAVVPDGGADAGRPDPCHPPIDTCTMDLAGASAILYSRAPSGAETDGTMWLRAADGSTEDALGPGSYPVRSPDGRYLAFHQGTYPPNRANIYLRDLMSAAPDLLVLANVDYANCFAFRNDSGSLVYDTGCTLHEVDVDGTNDHVLLAPSCYADWPAVSPTDGRLAFHDNTGLFVAAADGTGVTAVPGTAAGDAVPVWTPDGQSLLYLHVADATTSSLFRIRPDGSAMVSLTSCLGPGEQLRARGALTPDGTRFVTAADIGGVNGLFVVALDGSGTIDRLCTPPGGDVEFVGAVLP